MFITFEGPEGSGKSTQIGQLTAFLRTHGYDVVQTREPGGTPIGDQIRACLHDVANTAMQPETEMLLYAASRAQLVREVIQPALDADKIVVCDRYVDSTLAYQGFGRDLNQSDLADLVRIATGGLMPDLTLLLDVDVAAGLARRSDGGEEMNRLDLESLAFHERVRAGYHTLVAADPARWEVVDASRPIPAIQQSLQTIVLTRLQTTPKSN